MNCSLRNLPTLILTSSLLIGASSAREPKRHANPSQQNSLMPCERMAQRLWRKFIDDQEFQWADYVDQVSFILEEQKKYRKILSILKNNRSITEASTLLETLNTQLDFDDQGHPSRELEVLWKPDSNQFGRYNKYQQPELALYTLLCERIEQKSLEECLTMVTDFLGQP